jgi:hypothetical protein
MRSFNLATKTSFQGPMDYGEDSIRWSQVFLVRTAQH